MAGKPLRMCQGYRELGIETPQGEAPVGRDLGSTTPLHSVAESLRRDLLEEVSQVR